MLLIFLLREIDIEFIKHLDFESKLINGFTDKIKSSLVKMPPPCRKQFQKITDKKIAFCLEKDFTNKISHHVRFITNMDIGQANMSVMSESPSCITSSSSILPQFPKFKSKWVSFLYFASSPRILFDP